MCVFVQFKKEAVQQRLMLFFSVIISAAIHFQFTTKFPIFNLQPFAVKIEEEKMSE